MLYKCRLSKVRSSGWFGETGDTGKSGKSGGFGATGKSANRANPSGQEVLGLLKWIKRKGASDGMPLSPR